MRRRTEIVTQPEPEQKAIVERRLDEELLVKGIRGSLLRSTSIKSEGSSIIDVVTKEDIGKFPDSNLAEAMQRIPGVSLNHENGEGSTLSVRGMSPEFGLMTINGRQMPTVYSRTFDFSRLSSENINAVRVHKTFEAHHDAGATSALIDIETSRPFDLEKNTFSIGSKIVYDESAGSNRSFTPEFSSLFSTKNDNENFGALVSATFQSRKSATEYASLEWTPFSSEDTPSDWPLILWYPYEFFAGQTTLERDRINTQVALQWTPANNIELTLDYTYANFSIEKIDTFINNFFNGNEINFDDISIYNEQSVIETTEYFGFYGFGKSQTQEVVELDSIGFNALVSITDSWQLDIDAHNAKSLQHPGNGNSFEKIVKSTISDSHYINLEQEIPYFYNNYFLVDFLDDATTETPSLEHFLRNNEGFVSQNSTEATINSVKLDLSWDNHQSGLFSKLMMGYSFSEFTVRARSFSADLFDIDEDFYLPVSDYNIDLFSEQRTLNILNQFDGDLGPSVIYYDFDIDELAQSIVTRIENGDHDDSSDFDFYDWNAFSSPIDEFQKSTRIIESTNSGYLQINLVLDNQYVPIEIFSGVRFEHTEGTSEESTNQIVDIYWRVDELGDSDFFNEYTQDLSTISESFDYTFWLPSLMFKFHLADSLVARTSYNKSVSRPSTFLMELGYEYLGYDPDWGHELRKGNPALLPYKTANFDLSIEWYYGEANYFALSRFQKEIENFPLTGSYRFPSTIVRDVYNGPRILEAELALLDMGIEPSDEAIFNYLTEGDEEARLFGLAGGENDPFVVWDADTLVNTDKVVIDGWELAIQHIFEESGFGFSLNYAFLDSDQKIGDLFLDDRTFSEFELPALAKRDSANVIGFYESENIQVRVAYHWNRAYPEYRTAEIGVTLPYYRESYGQVDGLISYQWQGFTLSLEGFNLTGAVRREHINNSKQFASAEQNGPHFVFGVRYNL